MVSFDICEGNPGALTFLAKAYNIEMFEAERGFQRMQDNRITGCKLYMLWNDCCNRDTEKAIKVMCNCDLDFIISKINYEQGRGIEIKDSEVNGNEYAENY